MERESYILYVSPRNVVDDGNGDTVLVVTLESVNDGGVKSFLLEHLKDPLHTKKVEGGHEIKISYSSTFFTIVGSMYCVSSKVYCVMYFLALAKGKLVMGDSVIKKFYMSSVLYTSQNLKVHIKETYLPFVTQLQGF